MIPTGRFLAEENSDHEVLFSYYEPLAGLSCGLTMTAY
jgi:hypothetical protein